MGLPSSALLSSHFCMWQCLAHYHKPIATLTHELHRLVSGTQPLLMLLRKCVCHAPHGLHFFTVCAQHSRLLVWKLLNISEPLTDSNPKTSPCALMSSCIFQRGPVLALHGLEVLNDIVHCLSIGLVGGHLDFQALLRVAIYLS